MSIFLTLLTVFLVMVSLLLVLITLMQRPKQEGLGAAFGGGMMNDTFGAQTTDVLQKATIWLTVAFLGTAILLAVLNTRHFEQQRNVGNILEGVQEPEPIPSFPTPGVTPPAAPLEAAPKADSTPKADSAPKADSKDGASKAAPAKKAPAAKTDEDKGKAADSKDKKAAKEAKTDTSKPAAKDKDKDKDKDKK